LILVRSRSDEHLSRKFFHLLSGTVIAFLFTSVFTREQAILWMVCFTVLLVFADLLRLSIEGLNRAAFAVFGPLMRENELKGPSAQLYYLLGLSWAVVFLPRTLAIQSILTLAWMDPLAAIFGVRFGRRRWKDVFDRLWIDERQLPIDLGAKTVEGSFAGFLAAFLAGIVAWTGPWAAVPLGAGGLWWPSPTTVLLFSAVGGLVAMVAEAWPSQWDDNINIPFWTGLLLWALALLIAVPLPFN
jgi:dolichol kinase